MDLIQYINKKEKEMFKLTVKDFVENRSKIFGKEKALEEITEMLKSFDKDDQKRVLTPLGTEIHSSESVISTKVRPLTLKDKLNELEQLSQRVMDRKILEATLSDLQGDDDPEFTDEDELDVEEDLSFGSRDFISEDEKGDKSIKIADDDGEQAAAPQSQAAEKPKSEAVEDGDAE